MAFYNNKTETKKRMIGFHEAGYGASGMGYCERHFHKNVLLKKGELIWSVLD